VQRRQQVLIDALDRDRAPVALVGFVMSTAANFASATTSAFLASRSSPIGVRRRGARRKRLFDIVGTRKRVAGLFRPAVVSGILLRGFGETRAARALAAKARA
jgi:hypothetical protein